MIAPATAYIATPSTRPSPAVRANRARTRAVPTTATTFSMRSSRLRVATTCSATLVPHAGQRPPGLRTRGAPHPGQSMWSSNGTGGTVTGRHRPGKGGRRLPEPRSSGSVRLGQRVVFGAASGLVAEHDDLRSGERLCPDGAQPAPQVLGLDA